MKKNQMISIFILLVCSLFIIVFTHIGTKVFSSFLGTDTYTKGTKVETVSVENLTEKQALTKLVSEIESWTENSEIVLSLDHSIVLDKELIQFQLEETVGKIEDKKTAELVVELDEESLNNILSNEFGQQRMSTINVKEISGEIKKLAMNLKKGTFEFDLMSYIENEKIEERLISETSIPIEEGVMFNEQLKTRIKIGPTDGFSLQDHLEEANLLDLSTEGLNKVATAIYTAILSTPFEIEERHISNELPAYSKLGLEAAFVKEKWDLKFYNPTDRKYELAMFVKDQQLFVQVHGKQMEEFKIFFDNESSYPTRTIIQYTPVLQENRKDVNIEGKDGQSVLVYRQAFIDGELQDEVKIAEDYYLPAYEVVHLGIPTNYIDTPLVEQPNGDEVDVPDENGQAESNQENNDMQQTEEQQESEIEQEQVNPSVNETDEENQSRDEGLWEEPKIEK